FGPGCGPQWPGWTRRGAWRPQHLLPRGGAMSLASWAVPDAARRRGGPAEGESACMACNLLDANAAECQERPTAGCPRADAIKESDCRRIRYPEQSHQLRLLGGASHEWFDEEARDVRR